MPEPGTAAVFIGRIALDYLVSEGLNRLWDWITGSGESRQDARNRKVGRAALLTAGCNPDGWSNSLLRSIGRLYTDEGTPRRWIRQGYYQRWNDSWIYLYNVEVLDNRSIGMQIWNRCPAVATPQLRSVLGVSAPAPAPNPAQDALRNTRANSGLVGGLRLLQPAPQTPPQPPTGPAPSPAQPGETAGERVTRAIISAVLGEAFRLPLPGSRRPGTPGTRLPPLPKQGAC